MLIRVSASSVSGLTSLLHTFLGLLAVAVAFRVFRLSGYSDAGVQSSTLTTQLCSSSVSQFCWSEQHIRLSAQFGNQATFCNPYEKIEVHLL